MAPPFRDGRGERTAMDWMHILSYVTGTVDQELLAQNEYLLELLMAAGGVRVQD